jgi:uncharacterized beta-barrel protein YwiB (DUF1934 family)
MENKCKITLKTTSKVPGSEPQHYEMTTVGELTTTKNGSVKVKYDETFSDGSFFENIVTAKGNATAKVSRRGDFGSDFTLEMDKKHFCIVTTPYGEMNLGILTHAISNNISAGGGELYLKYSLDANSSLISDNEVNLSVTI